MVNEKSSTKSKILEILRISENPVNGDTLAKEAGVSRVAVWKAVQTLQQSGYEISSNRSGYCLEKDLTDSLFPWEFGTEENLYSHFIKTDSTMTQAREIAESCKNHDLRIVTADVQTAGKGHMDHKWTTTRGSIACTVVTKEAIPAAESHRLIMCSQLALAKVLAKHSKRPMYIRWPNDIWTDSGKIGGILDDVSSTGGLTNWLNLGIGINLSQRPKLENTDCVFPFGKSASRKEIMQDFIEQFRMDMQQALKDTDDLAKEWNSFCPDIGKKMQLKNSACKFTFKGINGYGWAITENKGQEKLFPPSTISLIKNGVN